MTAARALTWLDNTLYRSTVRFALCTTEKAFHAELKRMGVPRYSTYELVTTPANATTHVLTDEDGEIACIVTVPPRQFKERYDGVKLACLLVHEAVHVWQEMRKRMGETNPSSEFEAYSIQRISQELMVAYLDQTRPSTSR